MKHPELCPQHIAICLLLGIIASGCTAARFASLQNDFISYREREQNTPSNLERWRELSQETSQGYLDIATAALDGASKAEKRATKVAFYRLAAISGWLAGEPGTVDSRRAQSLGSQECKSNWKGQYQPARDCAILLILPAIVASTTMAPRIADLEQAISDGVLPDERAAEARELFESYPGNTWAFIRSARTDVERLRGVDASVLSYLTTEEQSYFCSFLTLERTISRLTGHQELRTQAFTKRQDMFGKMQAQGRETDCS